jgi:hypothetical protein
VRDGASAPQSIMQCFMPRSAGTTSTVAALQVLDTPSGRLVQSLYEQGCKLGVSSRGWASLRELPGKCYKCIMSNFELITFDFVTEPSTRGAWLLPYVGQYLAAVPSQAVAEAVSRLGVGAVSTDQFVCLPKVRDLQAGFAEYQRRLQVRHLPSGAHASDCSSTKVPHCPHPLSHNARHLCATMSQLRVSLDSGIGDVLQQGVSSTLPGCQYLHLSLDSKLTKRLLRASHALCLMRYCSAMLVVTRAGDACGMTVQKEPRFPVVRMLGPAQWSISSRTRASDEQTSGKKRTEPAATDTSHSGVREAICPGMSAGMPHAGPPPTGASASADTMHIPVSSSYVLTYPSPSRMNAPIAYGSYVVHAHLFGVPSQHGLRDYWRHAFLFKQRTLLSAFGPHALRDTVPAASALTPDAKQQQLDERIVFTGGLTDGKSDSLDSGWSTTTNTIGASALLPEPSRTVCLHDNDHEHSLAHGTPIVSAPRQQRLVLCQGEGFQPPPSSSRSSSGTVDMLLLPPSSETGSGAVEESSSKSSSTSSSMSSNTCSNDDVAAPAERCAQLSVQQMGKGQREAGQKKAVAAAEVTRNPCPPLPPVLMPSIAISTNQAGTQRHRRAARTTSVYENALFSPDPPKCSLPAHPPALKQAAGHKQSPPERTGRDMHGRPMAFGVAQGRRSLSAACRSSVERTLRPVPREHAAQERVVWGKMQCSSCEGAVLHGREQIAMVGKWHPGECLHDWAGL